MNSPGLARRGGGLAPASRWATSRQSPANPLWRDALAALVMAGAWAGWGLLLLMAAE